MTQHGPVPLTADEAPLEAPRDASASPPRLLLVEDDEPTRRALAEALNRDGFEVVIAANGREALERLRRGPPPSAILLDVMMPEMDGWDFRHAQLTDPSLREIPVLIVSASGFSIETIRSQFGDVELIRKPIHYPGLLRALGRACPPASAAD